MLELLHSSGCGTEGAAYYYAASGNHGDVLRWLHSHGIPAPNTRSDTRLRFSDIMLLFLGDIGAHLEDHERARLLSIRRSSCTFHGLLRWCCRAVSDPSRGAHRAFDYLSSDGSGQELLVLLSMLPRELIRKIAVVAGLQHDVF